MNERMIPTKVAISRYFILAAAIFVGTGNAEIVLSVGPDIAETCASRTGLTSSDVSSAQSSSMGCALNCIVLGNHYKYYVNEGAQCHDFGDWKCSRGQCSNKHERDEQPQPKNKLYNVTIQVRSAVVQDEDKMPFNGESDVMVLVKVYNTDGEYPEGTLIGHTPTIQDTNSPVWDSKLTIKPNPIPLSSRVKFIVFDSDKPAKPDFLGYFVDTIENLISDEEKSRFLVNKEGKEIRPYRVVIKVTTDKMITEK